MKSSRHNKVALPLNQAIKQDLVFFNNPILIQGLALTPVIAAAISVKNAFILSLALVIIVIPTRIISELLLTVTAKIPRLRIVIYVLVSAIMYIPAYFAVTELFGNAVAGPGIYLPMLVVDGIVISRFELPTREKPLQALGNGIKTVVGAVIVLIVVGTVREILGEGTIYGTTVFENPPLKIMSSVIGGLLVVAVFAAVLQSAAGLYKREHFIVEAKENE